MRAPFPWFGDLSQRLERVRVTCGDWRRVASPVVLDPLRDGSVGVFLDPPYPVDVRGAKGGVSYAGGCSSVWDDVTAWAAENGDDLRIVLAGYAGTFDMPDGWTATRWRSRPGYQGGSGEEVLWASPRCTPRQAGLFGGAT